MFRQIWYVTPFVGGRARGRQRPRAPSLSETASGQRRRALSLAGFVKGNPPLKNQRGRRKSNRNDEPRHGSVKLENGLNDAKNPQDQ